MSMLDEMMKGLRKRTRPEIETTRMPLPSLDELAPGTIADRIRAHEGHIDLHERTTIPGMRAVVTPREAFLKPARIQASSKPPIPREEP